MKRWVLIILIVISSLGVRLLVNKPQIELVTPGKVVPEAVKSFKFIVMADIHNDNEELKKAIEKAKESNNEMVILAGDLTINGNKNELEAVWQTLEKSGIKYLVIPGNHDVLKNQFGKVFGISYQVMVKDKLKLLLIDNSLWSGLGEEQKKWIEKEVEGCNVIVCVAVMHMPLEHGLSGHVMGENNKKVTEEAEWLHQLLVNNGVKSIYAGHLHYADRYTIDGLETNLVGAISRVRNNQTPKMDEVEFNGKETFNKIVDIE